MIATRLKLMTGAGMVALTLLGLGSAAVVGQNAPARTLRVVVNDQEDPVDPAITPPAAAAPKSKAAAPEKKYAAKGIADDDVPYAAVPGQAVVRYEDNKLIVRQRSRSVVGTRVDVNGQQVMTYEVRSTVTGKTSDPADVAVFDMKGNRVAEKVWKEKLKADQHVLLANEGKLPHPRELTLFKDDTLVIVLPTHMVEYPVPAPAEFNLFRKTHTGDVFEMLPAGGGGLGGTVFSKPAPPMVPPAPPATPALVVPGRPAK